MNPNRKYFYEETTVVVNYHSDKSLAGAEAVLEKIKSAGANGVIHQCNISEEEDVKKMFAEILTQFGTVDRICR